MSRGVATMVAAALAALGGAAACERARQPMPPAQSVPSAREALFVYVKIPAPILPIERGERFEDPLDAALREAGVGEVTGGGSGLTAPDARGRQHVEYCGIDVDLSDADKGLPILRRELVRLDVPPGTVLQYTRGGKEHEVAVHSR